MTVGPGALSPLMSLSALFWYATEVLRFNARLRTQGWLRVRLRTSAWPLNPEKSSLSL